MALDILHDNWGPYTHTEVENALKAYLSVLENRINQAIQSGGVGMADLSAEVQALLYKANTALQPENIAAWAKAQNKPGYTVSEITGVEGFQNLLAKLQDMDQKIQAAAQSGGVDLNTTMEVTGDALALPATTQAIKTYVDAAISNINAIINTITQDGATAGVIDTFLEVKNFLAGIDTSDPTLYNQLASLNSAILALQGKVAGKANTSDVASTYATKSELTGKQDTLTFDNVPTAGSNNPVKSGGIKTAIDYATPTISQNGKWVIGGIETDVDARGPQGNSILVNENAQGIQALIVNSFNGGETNILSAEMGKVLMINILRIYNYLGAYAFPNGKPILDWGGITIKHVINDNGVTGGLSVSDVEVDGTSVGNSLPDEIIDGKSLSFKLNLPSNMYVFDDDVTITMGGVDITNQTGVWNESTGEIYIDAVLGAVVITAAAITYVGYGEQNSDLAFMLDCKNRGNQSGHWVDMIGNVDFTLGSGVTPADTGVEFDGSSNAKGVSSGTLEILFENATVEIVATRASASVNSPFLSNTDNNRVSVRTRIVGVKNTDIASFACTTPSRCAFPINNILTLALSANTSRYRIGNVVSDTWNTDYLDYITKKATTLAIGYHKDLSTNEETYLNGTIKAIRVYNHGSGGTKLSADDMAHNYKVDQKRFNLS